MSTLTKFTSLNLSAAKLVSNYKLIKHELLYLNFVSTSIIRISSYILCLLSSKKNINTSQSHQAILVDCHKTFQYLGGEDSMLPSLSFFILRMKNANGIKTLANQ